MKHVHLSKRLRAIVDLLGRDNAHYDIVADVGCDHGWVSIALIQKGIADHVVASDIRPGPLERAKEHIVQYALEEKIETALAGGLDHIGGGNGTVISADAAVISGMGGIMICNIIEDSAKRDTLPKELLLQPQLHWTEVRQCLRRFSYQIVSEDMVKEDGKYYVIMHARCGAGNENDTSSGFDKDPDGLSVSKNEKVDAETALDDRYGPCLLTDQSPVLKEWLLLQQKNYRKIQTFVSGDHEDRDGIDETLHYLELALERFDTEPEN